MFIWLPITKFRFRDDNETKDEIPKKETEETKKEDTIRENEENTKETSA